MDAPAFRLLDEVAARFGKSDAPGTVTQVRRYSDGSVRYVVAPLDENEVATVFDECDLTSTGRRTSPTVFTTMGAFRVRDIVRVSRSTALADVAGKLGVIVGGSPGSDSVAVWINDLREVWCMSQADLELTGERQKPERSNRTTSLRVSSTGQARGSDEYEILDDVAYL